MAKFFDALSPEHIKFIAQQKLFFVATAPHEGRISLSPKGMDTFRCLSDTQVGYLDLTGSGNETAAHILNDGRMTIMFCSFEKKPLILRLYGRGEVVHPRDTAWSDLLGNFTAQPGIRQIILLHIESTQTSCGYSIPFYEFTGERSLLNDWAINKGDAGIEQYWEQKNQTSIDGLPTHLLED